MLTKDQYEQLEEYLETILELYTAEEYEEYVENIVYNYCKNRFGISDRKNCDSYPLLSTPLSRMR